MNRCIHWKTRARVRRAARRCRGVTAALAAGALLALSPAAPAGDPVVMGSIGDFGAAALGPAQAAVELSVASLVKRWNPDFIFTTGDNNYPNGAAATIDLNIGQFYHEFIHPYAGTYGGGASSNRFFPCLGNHDWVSAGQPYLDYFVLPGNERYYRHRAGPVELFIVNSNPDPDGATSGSVQGQWLQAALAASTARWKLVSLHHPPYSADVNGAGNPGMRWPFAAWGATAVLAGHDHHYARIHTNGIVYFINGLGGDSIAGFGGASAAAVRYNADYGAMRLQATDTNLVFHFISRANVIVDTHVLGAPMPSPLLLAPPVSQTTLAGRNVTFDVLAAGTGTLRYQWRTNGVDLPGATNRVLSLTNVQAAHEADYTARVSSGAAFLVSPAARLTLLRHPIITLQPVAQSVSSGGTVTFRLAAEGAGPLTHQWARDGTDLPGATATNLVITNVQFAHAGDYQARVTDSQGSITSNPARLTVLARPTVFLNPVSQSAAVGETVVFSAAATGTLPMGYSWRRNGRILTNIVLHQATCFWALAGVQLTNAGGYQVGVTNVAGIASGGLTPVATLTVLEDTDGDRMPDAWESANGFDPADPADATLDTDRDGLSNGGEYAAGTDPHDPANTFRIERLERMPDGLPWLEFNAAFQRTYAVQFRDAAPEGDWMLLEAFPAMATNRVLQVFDPVPQPSRFYRLVTPWTP